MAHSDTKFYHYVLLTIQGNPSLAMGSWPLGSDIDDLKLCCLVTRSGLGAAFELKGLVRCRKHRHRRSL